MSIKPLSEETKKKYLSHRLLCPFCGSVSIEHSLPVVVSNHLPIILIYTDCRGCNKEWEETYILKDINELIEVDGQRD